MEPGTVFFLNRSPGYKTKPQYSQYQSSSSGTPRASSATRAAATSSASSDGLERRDLSGPSTALKLLRAEIIDCAGGKPVRACFSTNNSPRCLASRTRGGCELKEDSPPQNRSRMVFIIEGCSNRVCETDLFGTWGEMTRAGTRTPYVLRGSGFGTCGGTT